MDAGKATQSIGGISDGGAAERPGLAARLLAFTAEHHPLALGAVRRVAALVGDAESEAEIEALRTPLANWLERALADLEIGLGELPETSPGVSVAERLERERRRVVDDCDGFLHRAALRASFTREERREMLRGMILTRAVDNRLKTFFTSGEVRFGRTGFQGKGFRSLGQEAIYAAALRLRRGAEWHRDGAWHGDVVSPMIRDMGFALAMRPEPEMVRSILNAQMAKQGLPMDGRDLHIGDARWGVLPPAAPLSIASLNIAGLAFAMEQEARRLPEKERAAARRVAIAPIGEGGTSLGEWHEAINICASMRLPAIFCVENNQTALSTPIPVQTAARAFADKAIGYGIPCVTLDGNDPEAVAAAFAWAADRARRGEGTSLLELVTMRMCGHAHHDDMLYLGHEPHPGWDYPEVREGGYVDRELWDFWAARDPIARYGESLIAAEIVSEDEIAAWKDAAAGLVEDEARQVVALPWPEATSVGENVYSDQPAARRVEILAERPGAALDALPGLPEVETGPAFDPRGTTFLEAVMLGVGDALRADERVFVYGEDVGGDYGNAFLLLRPLLEEFGDRILNSPLTEAGTLGVCVGAALGGLRPIGEIQFNDFVATGFNQLVNNAAKIRYRWGAAQGFSVPMVVRMPWGGLRKAGPYHSQNTEPWFYRTPGLKIVAPSTPADARALMASAVADPDPVLYYEHIGLYRDPRVKQELGDEPPEPLPLGKAALRRAGDDLLIVSYGAYVHIALRVAARLSEEGGIEASVLDLRSLVPLDREALLRCARHCGRVLIVHEDTRTGSIGESLAAILQEEIFEYLDAPIRILGALDTPVPYAPSLEAAFLPSEEEIERAARLLAAY